MIQLSNITSPAVPQPRRVAPRSNSRHAPLLTAPPSGRVHGACSASSRDLEDDFTGSGLFDNGEVPTSEERESVAARLRRRRMQLRAEASRSTVLDGSNRGREASAMNGVRRRRRRAAVVDVDLDAREDGEDGTVYDVDVGVDVGVDVDVDVDVGAGYGRGIGYDGGYDDGYEQEARRGDVYEAEYEDPYLGWGDGPAGTSSWSGDEAGPERRNRAGAYGKMGADGGVGEGVGEGEDAESPSSSSGEYQDTTNLLEPPDIVILNPEELDRVLPVLPFSEQADFFSGGAAQAVQRWGASLALTVLFSKAALVAATSLTWPLWWPWVKAANKNFSVRSNVEYGGIWRTRILEVERGNRPRPRFGGEEEELRNMPRFSAMKTCTIVVGEENGAQTKLVLPFDARYELLQPGQPAEVLVLSDSTSFSDIKAIKDVYLPDVGLWLAEYPYIDRAEFLEVSLEIEREVGGEVGNDPDDPDGDAGY